VTIAIASTTTSTRARPAALGRDRSADHVGRETTLGTPVSRSISTSAETMQASEPGPIALAPGTQVSRYVVRDFLGAGAMGVVYGRDQLDRSVALKVVRASAGNRVGQQRALRFVRRRGDGPRVASERRADLRRRSDRAPSCTSR
jgi:hypothetical protein